MTAGEMCFSLRVPIALTGESTYHGNGHVDFWITRKTSQVSDWSIKLADEIYKAD
jgi:hypothetical protein